MNYPCTRRRITALLTAVTAALALSVHDADAAGRQCKANGATCSQDAGCCSGCVKIPISKRRFRGVRRRGQPERRGLLHQLECASPLRRWRLPQHGRTDRADGDGGVRAEAAGASA
jgi:hypothetical protein